MPCKPIHNGFACSRGTNWRRCQTCGRPATKLCDYPVKDGPCDRPCCEMHAFHAGQNIDYCRPHWDLAEKRKAEEAKREKG